ncbi:sensor histidine kinase [Thiosulfativibrio zosterae]|uniref:histidine kinase n=1 Tax=Thiosulfativibrio zosterae TaxID=2675053 RepID=A0A6F8PQA6_9GAMM|nr:ATP-binding protein [Thiosulfativibrio zosterae]BBP44266.1 two-component sensor histidine kinase [Thiosulfativibrio zosterae]
MAGSLNKRQFIKQYGWLLALSSILLMLLVVMSHILQNASEFAEFYTWLLLLSFVGVATLTGFLIKTLYQLYLQQKENVPGIKLTIKLTSILSLVVGIPIAIIYYFAVSFIHQGIDQWFDVKTEQALRSAVELVKSTQDDQVRNHLNNVFSQAISLTPALISDPISAIDKLRSQLNAQEASLYSKNGQLVAYSTLFSVNILPSQPSKSLFQQLRQQRTYAALEVSPGVEKAHQVIRILVPINDNQMQVEYTLQVIFPIQDNITRLANEVRIASGQYQELSYLKGPLKTSFILILSMVLLLTLVTAVLFTIQTIQNMAHPIRVLAKGTQAVMDGDYTVAMPIETQDEFGQLIQSFNKMTQQIAKARNDIKFGHQQTEVQKLYLQTIIKTLKSGVLTFNANRHFKTANDAANDILNVNFHKHLGKPLQEVLLLPEFEHLHPVYEQIFEFFKQQPNWNHQLTFDCIQGQKILLIHGSTLPSLDQDAGGYVVVIEDITQIVQAQLHAAWSDVAQRLAHEIKNPLTPIQLSAERLNYKLSSKLEGDDKDLLSRMTHTITEQVDAMKNLVQAFTEYADTPEINLRKMNINTLIEDIVGMYRDPQANWYITCELDETFPTIQADSAKLRQLLHNLVKNALEACENQTDTLITISTLNQPKEHQLLLSICDNGPGIPAEAKNWIFEPYATNKPKGTGLGLAIVKKIVDEHQGTIRVETAPTGGTCFIITLKTP